jgi:hypothetical protein
LSSSIIKLFYINSTLYSFICLCWYAENLCFQINLEVSQRTIETYVGLADEGDYKIERLLRPCERRNISTFVFSQNLKDGIFRIFHINRIYWVKIEFLFLWNTCSNFCENLTKSIRECFWPKNERFWPQSVHFWPKNVHFWPQNVHFWPQDLQKAEYSDFCIFAKFKTRNIPYILNISRQNLVKIKFIFSRKTHSDSNFNQIFYYDYGMQGLKDYKTWNTFHNLD